MGNITEWKKAPLADEQDTDIALLKNNLEVARKALRVAEHKLNYHRKQSMTRGKLLTQYHVKHTRLRNEFNTRNKQVNDTIKSIVNVFTNVMSLVGDKE